MRILSQDGMIFNDIPYEKFCFGITRDRTTNNFCVVARKMLASESGFKLDDVMAEYSAESKARKAMEMLREEYTGMPSIRRMDDLYGRFKHTGKKDFELFIEHMVLKKCYFQFPADDEVEV